MPRLKVNIADQELAELPEQFRAMVSDNNAIRLVKAMGCLMKTGDLGFWLSPRLVRKIKALAKDHQGESSQSTEEIDEELFLSFLQQGGSMEPSVRWEVESLPNNGGIYKMLLKGGKDAQS